jgi:hypothetical protein
MRLGKRVLCEERLRRVPPQFSWVDHRLVRGGFCRRCRPEELALYLLLVTVGDAAGVSYYADESIARLINVPVEQVPALREGLCRADLLAWSAPLYQVLALPEVAHA